MNDEGDESVHESVTEHNNDLFTDPSQSTQDMITDSQFNDEDMYNLIKTEFGQLDRKTFKTSLLQYTDLNDLKPIRTSLFDLIRKSDNSLLEAKLIERTNRDNSQPPGEKLADDIYVIYQYIHRRW